MAPDDEHNPKVFSQIVLVLAYDFPQTASNTIANSCTAEASRRNKSRPRRAGILHREHGEQHQLPTVRAAVLFHTLEFRSAR
jgi:hypothetical protein